MSAEGSAGRSDPFVRAERPTTARADRAAEVVSDEI
jgi:hypothetical protein